MIFSQLVHDSDEIVKKKERKNIKEAFPRKNKTLSAAPPNLHHNFFFRRVAALLQQGTIFNSVCNTSHQPAER